MMAAGVYMGFNGAVAMGANTALFGFDIFMTNAFGWSPISKVLEGPLRAGFSAFGRDTSFMDKEGFSFFQFTSDHLTNLILTQLTFMMIGGAFRGLTTIRTARDLVTYGARSQNPTGRVAAVTYGVGAFIVDITEVTWLQIGANWLIHQASALFGGAVFLLTFQLLSQLTDTAGVIPQLVLQALILAQVTLQAYGSRLYRTAEVEAWHGFAEARAHGFLFGGLRWLFNALKSGGKYAHIRLLAALELAVMGLKIGTIAVSAFG